MEMLHDNCVIAEEIFTEVARYNKDAIHICVTSPLDVITMKIQQVTGQAPGRSSAPAPSWRAPGWCAMWRISWRSPTGPSTCPWWGSMAPAPWP